MPVKFKVLFVLNMKPSQPKAFDALWQIHVQYSTLEPERDTNLVSGSVKTHLLPFKRSLYNNAAYVSGHKGLF